METQGGSTVLAAPPPLFDLVLDLDHPGALSTVFASSSSVISWFPSLSSASKCQEGSSAVGKNVRAELSSEAFVPRVLPFCFPAYTAVAANAKETLDGGGVSGSTKPFLNRFQIYCHQFVSKPFVFALQLQCGQRVFGYVKPYLPPHVEARHRIDVGRRSVRAIVIFTRRDGVQHSGDSFVYPNLLDCLEQLMLYTDYAGNVHQKVQTLLNELYDRDLVSSKSGTNNNFFYASSLKAVGLEYNSNLFLHEDVVPFATVASAPISRTIMPLLRRLGPSHLMRIVSAILCERRIVFVSADPTRLTNACQACRAILAHGKLSWQHVFVPMVPPHLMPHLAAPFPYICGILTKYLDSLKLPEMGTFLLVLLDKNALQVYGADANAESMFPDLLRPIFLDDRYVQQSSAVVVATSAEQSFPCASATLGGVQGQHTHYQPDAPQIYTPSSSTTSQTISECLAQDLSSILRLDQTLWAVTTGASGKAADAVVESFSKGVGNLRSLVKAVKNAKRVTTSTSSPDTGINNESSSSSLNSNDVNMEDEAESLISPEEQKRLSDTLDMFWDGEFAFNARAEEELRVTLTSFFVCLLGDHSTFLSPTRQLDRTKFIEQRKLRGDYEGTPMYVVLTHFVQSQILEQFARETAATIGVPLSSLFDTAVSHLQKNKSDFSLMTVKQVVKNISQNSPFMKTIHNAQVARERALALTSKTGYSNSGNTNDINSNNNLLRDPVADLAQLCEACRSIPEVCTTTMAVLWTRIRDSKGMQSKHALLALQVIKYLMLHGPLTCVANISENIHVIRLLKVYHSRLSRDSSQQIRALASQIYILLMDRSLLMIQRRHHCAVRKRGKKEMPQPQLLKRAKFSNTLKFTQVHDALRPGFAVGSLKVMDLLDFDGGNSSLSHSSAAIPVLQTANSSVSYSLDELLSLDSGTAEPKPDLFDTMKDLHIGASASCASVKSVPGFSGNPFDLLSVSTTSSTLGAPESDTKIITTGLMPMLQHQVVSSFKPEGVNPNQPMHPPQPVHHLPTMINQSSAPLGHSPFTTQQRTSNFDPYLAYAPSPEETRIHKNSTPTFQQQQQHFEKNIMKSNNISQPPFSTHQAAVSLMVAQQQQQFVQVQSSADGGRRHVHQHLPTTAIIQGQQQQHHQLHVNAISSLQQVSVQQQSSMSRSFPLPHYGVGNAHMTSELHSSSTVPDSSTPQRQVQGPYSMQKTEQYKSNIQFDPFA